MDPVLTQSCQVEPIGQIEPGRLECVKSSQETRLRPGVNRLLSVGVSSWTSSPCPWAVRAAPGDV